VYLHVLSPLDKGEPMPSASVQRDGDRYVVNVGDLTYTFAPLEIEKK
jgi:hypothetical protein